MLRVARNFGGQARRAFLDPRRPASRSHERGERSAKAGGEGRTRTFEAARATDLQSAAFDRFATSPTVCVLETRCVLDFVFRCTVPETCRICRGLRDRPDLELAKGFEPPTC